MFFRPHRFLLLSALFLGALITAHLLITCRSHAVQEQPFGLYNARQILQRTESVCRVLAPQAGRLLFSAERIARHKPHRTLQRTWEAECEDTAGNHIAHFVWDADTGSLCVLGHNPHLFPQNGPGELRTQQDAREAARHWMRVLGIAGRTSSWQLGRAPKEWEGSWHINWEGEGRVVRLTLWRVSGQLISVQNWPLPRKARGE